MALGHELTGEQVQEAVRYNEAHLNGSFLATVRVHLGLSSSGYVDEDFVRHVATWQETAIRRGLGDGKVGPMTEAHLNILLPEAQRAAEAAELIYRRGGVIFDSWGNDMRDNDGDGNVDDAAEQTADGAHYGREYQGFDIRRGAYAGGWDFRRRTVTITRDRSIRAALRYAVCADIVSDAYQAAGVMPHHGSTGEILREFRRKGYVWRRSESYPNSYLPGDFICTWAPGGGHSGIVVERRATDGGNRAPLVVELPGPSSQVSDGTYDPASTNDVVRHTWSSWRIVQLPTDVQYLCRLLHSRLHVR